MKTSFQWSRAPSCNIREQSFSRPPEGRKNRVLLALLLRRPCRTRELERPGRPAEIEGPLRFQERRRILLQDPHTDRLWIFPEERRERALDPADVDLHDVP